MAALAALAAIVVLAACARRHDRVEVVGLVVAVDDHAPPPAGEVREPLPPMPSIAIAPDTREGSVLVAVDRREFWRRTGRDFPTWSPTRSSVAGRDRAYDDLRSLRIQLDALRAALAALPTTDAGGRPLLAPRDWSTLTGRVLALAQRLDAYLACERIAGDGTAGGVAGAAAGGPLDGDALAQRLIAAQWRGIDDAVHAALLAGDALVAAVADAIPPTPGDAASADAERAAPTPSRSSTDDNARSPDDRVASPPLAPGSVARTRPVRITADLAAAVGALAEVTTARDASAFIPRLRVACAALEDLEAAPAIVEAVSGDDTAEHAPTTGSARSPVADALVAMRRALTAVATRWLADQAEQIDPQPRPTLVYRPAATMD